MKVMIVVGARPNFMKAAPLIFALRRQNQIRATGSSPQAPVQTLLVHTGQHYDQAMSGTFFADLGLPQPDIYLGVGSASHAVQTAEIMRQFEGIVMREKPDAVVVVGDVNSTVACALVTSKVSFDLAGTRPLIAHVEAGLRSFDRAMPEEINRIMTDHLSDLLFVTEESGIQNLDREGIPSEKIHLVGNTMIDTLLASREKAAQSSILTQLGLGVRNNGGMKPFALLTLHRPSNVDHRDTLVSILQGLDTLAMSHSILFPVHPRTRKRIAEFGLDSDIPALRNGNGAAPAGMSSPGIHLLEPLGYLDFLCLMENAFLVVTDSGGIQEETTCLKVPCVTVRENTERPVTVTCGSNRIAGTTSACIRESVQQQLSNTAAHGVPEFWDGRAAERIVEILLSRLDERAPDHTAHNVASHAPSAPAVDAQPVA